MKSVGLNQLQKVGGSTTDKTRSHYVVPADSEPEEETLVPEVSKSPGEDEIIVTYTEGYRGWLVCLGVSMISFAVWGNNLALSVYILYFIDNKDSPESSGTSYSRPLVLITTGLSLSVMLIMAPFSNLIENRIGMKKLVFIGGVISVVGVLLSTLSNSLLNVILTQSLLASIGRGFATTPISYVISQWFDKRATLATGLSHSGSGAGGILFSYMTSIIGLKYGMKISSHVGNLVFAIFFFPGLILLKTRNPRVYAKTGLPVPIPKKTDALDFALLHRKIIILLLVRTFLSHWAYTVVRSTLPMYARTALKLSQSQGAQLQMIFSLGLTVGRPIIGMFADKVGVVKAVILLEVFILILYLVMWLPTTSFVPMAVFSGLQGALGGVVLLTSLPLSMVLGKTNESREILTFVWIVSAVSSLMSASLAELFIVAMEKYVVNDKLSAYRMGVGLNAIILFSAIVVSGFMFREWRRMQTSKQLGSNIA